MVFLTYKDASWLIIAWRGDIYIMHAGTDRSNVRGILRFVVDDDELQRASATEITLRCQIEDAIIERDRKVNKMQDVPRKVTETDTKLENAVRG